LVSQTHGEIPHVPYVGRDYYHLGAVTFRQRAIVDTTHVQAEPGNP